MSPRIGYLLAMNAFFPLVLIALPSTPIFGGTKHWTTGYPFFALLGGIAVSRVVLSLQAHGSKLAKPAWVRKSEVKDWVQGLI